MATTAGVSEKEFYTTFATDEQCYCAAFEQGLARLSEAVEQASACGESWLERVRAGVVGLLGFFDDEPQWARVLLRDAPVAGTVALRCRQRLLGVLTGLLDENRLHLPERAAAALTGELVAGGVFSVIRARLVDGDGRPFVELAPSLLAFIALQHGTSAPAAPAQRVSQIARAAALPIRATHRTTLVLRAIAQAPYSNNREVAQAAGLLDEGQTSKLLARLERQGVIENVGVGAARGEPNAWLLTAEGRRVVELLGENAGAGGSRRANGPVRGAA